MYYYNYFSCIIAIQNFYRRKNANNNITTAKAYAKLQNKIEIVGNIYQVSKNNQMLFKKI